MENSIGDFQLDQLKEIINIGASHASTALSQMIKREVMITIPDAHVSRIENINEAIGASDKEATAVLLKVYGDADGVMFFMFANGYAKALTDIMAEQCCNTGAGMAEEMRESAIQEIGNVLAGATLSAFSKFLDINLLHSVTDVVTDMENAIVNTVASEIGKSAYDALVLKVNFAVKSEDINTDLFFFIGPKTTNELLAKMKEKYSM